MKKMNRNCIKTITCLLMCAALCIASALAFLPGKQASAEVETEYFEAEIAQDGTVTTSSDDVEIEVTSPNQQSAELLYDTAGLLDEYEADKISDMLTEVSERQLFSIVIVTLPELPDGYSAMEYADDFYDYGGFGYNAGRDGTLLLVSMEEREWYISTTGYGITAITDYGREAMADKFRPAMSDGDYYESFKTFIESCDEYVTQARTGKPYDVGNAPKKPFNFPKKIFISLVIGFIVAFIVVMVMRGQLKSVRAKGSAAGYMRPGSMDIRESRDTFLYTHITKTERPKESSSGGSRTHTSSSGSSHGGGGGHF